MANELNITPFPKVYDAFFNKITDDMYMELSENDTYLLLQSLLKAAITWFEFPRVNLNDYTEGDFTSPDQDNSLILNNGNATLWYDAYDPAKDYDLNKGYFNVVLSKEEIDILATYMVVEWLSQQLASIENVRMKYSGSDFKFTSQANHIQKVLALQKDYERKGFHLQRLYKRRKADENGVMRSTFGSIMGTKEV